MTKAYLRWNQMQWAYTHLLCMCIIRSGNWTWFCACPKQINNVGMVTDVSQHLELRHQSLLFHRLVFLCSVKYHISYWHDLHNILHFARGINMKYEILTFQHLDGHLLWDSRLVDAISCSLDHLAKGPRAQLLTWGKWHTETYYHYRHIVMKLRTIQLV